MRYIKTLEHTLQALQIQIVNTVPDQDQAHVDRSKDLLLADHRQWNSSRNLHSESVSFRTWLSPNVVVHTFADDAQISICSPTKSGISAAMFNILEKHKLEVISAHISSDHSRTMLMIYARVSDDFSIYNLTMF